jgi:NAD(P)-dependent dehydrogenase (short-subunit alcohol dehydrogenase family)
MGGKAIVITGAGRGLGEAYALHAAQAGAAVVVNDIDGEYADAVAENINANGGRAVASADSVSDPESAARIIDLCVREFGRLDGLVNNAALNYDALPWEDTAKQARELIEVNVLGTMYCGLAAMRVMQRHGGGAIVNICSGASFGQRKLASYAASKGAVASLTYSWALDAEDAGIRVNAVCPLAHTRMVWTSERALRGCPPSKTPAKIAPLVLFLLSDAAEGITGQLIRCTGSQLHIVGQPYVKQPVLEREFWDTESIRRAFDEVFSTHLEPYGLEKRQPPRMRHLLSTLDSA